MQAKTTALILGSGLLLVAALAIPRLVELSFPRVSGLGGEDRDLEHEFPAKVVVTRQVLESDGSGHGLLEILSFQLRGESISAWAARHAGLVRWGRWSASSSSGAEDLRRARTLLDSMDESSGASWRSDACTLQIHVAHDPSADPFQGAELHRSVVREFALQFPPVAGLDREVGP
jgi:hypothetical protein